MADTSVFRNPDGTPRWTFSHAEALAHFTGNRGMPKEQASDMFTMMVAAGAWEVSVDAAGREWYTVKEGYRQGDPKP